MKYEGLLENILRGANMITFGQYLKSAREAAGLSQKDVGNILGCHVQYISNIERSCAFPPISYLKKMSKLYKTNESELKGRFLTAMADRYRTNLIKKMQR